MNEFFSDPAWKASALLAAAFGGFLTVWIAKLTRWVAKQFSAENREDWKRAKAEVEARREEKYEAMVRNPMLIVLNTLHIALIFGFVISVASLVAALPTIAEGARYSALVATQTLCPSTTSILSSYCDIQPVQKDWPLSDENILKYFWIVVPALFLYLLFFFSWFWASLFQLFRVYRKALRGYNIASPWF